jgi:hypothetical protein
MNWDGQAVRREKKTNAYKILIGEPERLRPLATPMYS